MSGWRSLRRHVGIPCWPDYWDTLAEFDTWETGVDYSDRAPEFDEAVMDRVSRTPLTDRERAAAVESTRGARNDVLRPDVRCPAVRGEQRITAEAARLRDVWRGHDEIIAAQQARRGR